MIPWIQATCDDSSFRGVEMIATTPLLKVESNFPTVATIQFIVVEYTFSTVTIQFFGVEYTFPGMVEYTFPVVSIRLIGVEYTFPDIVE